MTVIIQLCDRTRDNIATVDELNILDSVCQFVNCDRPDRERNERGDMTLDDAAQPLKVTRSTVRRLIDGALPVDHPCPGAPWLYQASIKETVRFYNCIKIFCYIQSAPAQSEYSS